MARVEYELNLHAALLRTMAAMLRTQRIQREQDHPALDPITEEIHVVEQRIAELPDSPEDRPMLTLARRLRCSDDEIGFLWAVVALAANPRMLVHARGLDDTASRGLSVSLYGRIASLDAGASRALGLALLPGHATSRNGLLLPARGEWVPAALPWMPAPELIRYLAGEPTSVAGLSPVVPPLEGALLDEAQQRAVAHIRAVLDTPQPFLLYIEGVELTGRRTAVVLASGGPVLALDLTSLGPSLDVLSAALVALRREAALRGACPIVAGIEELVSAEGGKDPRMQVLAQHLNQSDRPVVLVSSWRGIDAGAQLPAVRVEWPIPDVATRGELWRELAGATAEHTAGFDLITEGGDTEFAGTDVAAGPRPTAPETAKELADPAKMPTDGKAFHDGGKDKKLGAGDEVIEVVNGKDHIVPVFPATPEGMVMAARSRRTRRRPAWARSRRARIRCGAARS